MADRVICIRADASPGLGSGQVMRCLALAAARQKTPLRRSGTAAEVPPEYRKALLRRPESGDGPMKGTG